MRTLLLFVLAGLPLLAQASFAVASIKPSSRNVGPDYNNQIAYGPDSLLASNVTLKRLVMEAHHLLAHQVIGPGWIDNSEYELQAKADPPVTQSRMQQMLQTLLLERFGLEFHRAKTQMRVYVLSQGKGGARIHPVKEESAGRPGLDHFHGELQEYADLLGVRLTMAEQRNPDPTKPMIAAGPPIPVIDRTGLLGMYNLDVQLNPEAASDPISFWQHALEDQLGLNLESRRESVETIVIDRAKSVPTGN